MKYIHHLLVMLLFVISNNSAAKNTEPTLENQIKQIVNQAYQTLGFNGSIALKANNQPSFEYSVGYQKENIELTSNHLFSSGSVGKEFTTVALLNLAEEGKLQLNDTITEYIPTLPSWGKKIKIEHLLSHTSGLPKIQWKNNITTEDVMAQVMSLKSLKFEPSTQYLYGNINVMLRSKVVEKVTGLPFDQYLKIHLLKPLEMVNTLQVLEIFEMKTKVSGDHPTAINGVTIYTTASDLLRWELALLNGSAINGKSMTKFISEHPVSGKHAHIKYDFGQFFMVNEKLVAVKHDGSNPSHHVLKYTNLTNQFSFVAMSSDGNKKTLYWLKEKIEALFQLNKLAHNNNT